MLSNLKSFHKDSQSHNLKLVIKCKYGVWQFELDLGVEEGKQTSHAFRYLHGQPFFVLYCLKFSSAHEVIFDFI
jgi:hypothetical protein